jgi:Sulfotransferase family
VRVALRSRNERAGESPRPAPWEQLGEFDEYRELCQARLRHLVPVREPLVLVSQIQRSGGTLLSQLLDGHPECHAHPFELKIGYPKEHDWPPLDLTRRETWFPMLFEDRVVTHFRRSYHKSAKRRHAYDKFPFLFLPRLQKAIFDASLGGGPPEGRRDVLDAYFTSYFNAWLDNHNLYTGPKRAVTGFTPRLVMHPASVEQFFADYPEGTLISIVRDPRAWYGSASSYSLENYADVEASLGLWRRAVGSALEASERFGERVLLLTYEQLVSDPEGTMSRVAERAAISMSPELLVPTFNGQPIRANSSDPVGRYGILPERASAYRESLDPAAVERIVELAGDLYERAVAAAR